MFLSAVCGAFADVPFLSHLDIDGLARLESACRDMREMIQESDAWGACLAHSHFFPSVSIQGEVLTAADRGAARRQRLEVKRLLSALASVHLVGVIRKPLAIATLDRAKELLATVTRGLNTATAHAEAGGSASRVVVGHLYFPSVMCIPAAIVNKAGESPNGGLHSAWSVSAPLYFSLPRCPDKSKRRGQGRGAKQSAEEWLCLRLAWRGDSVLARITEPGTCPVASPSPLPGAQSSGRGLALDVRALGSAPILRSRGTVVRVGGPWEKVSGVCAALLPPTELAEALKEGLACVVCVRDTLGLRTAAERRDFVLSTSSWCTGGLNALSLELPPATA